MDKNQLMGLVDKKLQQERAISEAKKEILSILSLALDIKEKVREAAIEFGAGLNGKDGKDGLPGKDGINGKDGLPGRPGKDGLPGRNGRDGKDGRTPVKGIDYFDGRDGVGILDTELENGELIITLTNGKKLNVGNVMSPATKGGTITAGRSGKSAFSYAEDAGYTGTEEEFGEALKGIFGDAPEDGKAYARKNGAWEEVTGSTGQDGASAYEIWLALGNVGTEQVFVDSLKGDEGAPGVDGYTPIKGVDYFDGAQGEQGIQGIAGTGGVITRYNAKASGDVSIAVANTWYTGASITLPAGTYLVTAQITVLRNTTTASTYAARISDGTNHYASAGDYRASVANNVTTLTMCTVITLASTTTINVQATGTQTATIKAALASNGVGNNATQISAIQLA